MDQTSAQQALEPFLALVKTATAPRAAADLITQATSAQGTYLFAELLAQKNIDNLKSDTQYGKYYNVLEIFAWGTWESYQRSTGLPQLNDAQTLKLRLLSLISYASERNGELTYATLCRRLGFEASIDLEHLVTTAIYTNLIEATLNPAERTVLITSVAPLRDLTPGSVKGMLDSLQSWSKRCDSVLMELEAEITNIKALASHKATQQARTDKQFKIALETSERKAIRDDMSGSSYQRGLARPANKRDATGPTYDESDDPMELDALQNGARKKSGGFLDRLKPRT